jgi:topoisomerase-4 subunit B
MDEAVGGHASRLELELRADGSALARADGRGIPVDPPSKLARKSALEVILTTQHANATLSGEACRTAGGLHGVGVAVVNALRERLDVEAARKRTLHRQSFGRGWGSGRSRQ